jgi:hypothetical protein
MNFVKNTVIYGISFFMLSAFNFSIFIGVVSENFAEQVLRASLKRSSFTATESLIKILKNNSDIATLTTDLEGREEVNIRIRAARAIVLRKSIKESGSIIWSRSLSEKLRIKILKEYFRKISWEIRCYGLEFNSEVPSA